MTSPTSVHVPFATTGIDIEQDCRACLTHGPHPSLTVPGDAATDSGVRDRFRYFACASCGTLQIVDIPDDLPRYYAGSYYSMRAHVGRTETGLKAKLTSRRNVYAATGADEAGRALYRMWPYPQLASLRPMMDGSLGRKRDLSASILDVGCGTGRMLRDLRAAGFTNLTGIDPHLPDTTPVAGISLIQIDIADQTGAFDIITFNHSLEHVPDPQAVLAKARRLLAPGGAICVRVPLADSEAWSIYGGEWGQLDAPRHISLFTRTGMSRLADRSGLILMRVDDDSTEHQFVLSELRIKGIRFHELDIHAAADRFIAPEARKTYRRRAAEINARGRGDQAAFYLQATG